MLKAAYHRPSTFVLVNMDGTGAFSAVGCYLRSAGHPLALLRTLPSITAKIGFVLSFPYPDRGALPYQPPDLVHLLVRHRDAPLGPVALHADPILQAVYHNVPAGIHPRLARARHVRRDRVRNMQRQMVFTARVPPIN